MISLTAAFEGPQGTSNGDRVRFRRNTVAGRRDRKCRREDLNLHGVNPH